MDLSAVWLELQQWQAEQSLFLPDNLELRNQALAFVALAERLAQTRRHLPEVQAFWRAVQPLGQQLEAANQQLFTSVQTQLRTGALSARAVRQLLERHTRYQPGQTGALHFGGEAADTLWRGVAESEPLPAESFQRSAEMIHFERTPVSVVLELVDRVPFAPDDRFYDLGAGLGSLVLLVSLLGQVSACGVEIEPAFCAYARRSAAKLSLSNVSFLNADAETLAYQDGTIFFLFTPFVGTLLQRVLFKLQRVAEVHPITICSYGPCTPRVAAQDWLLPCDDHGSNEFKLALFCTNSVRL